MHNWFLFDIFETLAKKMCFCTAMTKINVFFLNFLTPGPHLRHTPPEKISKTIVPPNYLHTLYNFFRVLAHTSIIF